VGFLAAVLPMGMLEEMVNIGTLFAFVLVCVGVVILRHTRPELPRGFRVPWVPVMPGLAVLACGWLMLNVLVETWIRFLLWMGLGLISYFAYGHRNSVLGLGLTESIDPAASQSEQRDTDRPRFDPRHLAHRK
jgi:basic amino acid/polyamine antiporter, APA family